MRKIRKFRPAVGEARLEDRLVLSTVHAAQIVAPVVVPTTTPKAIWNTTVNVHNQVYQRFLNAEQHMAATLINQVNRGIITADAANTQFIAFTTNTVNALLPALQRASAGLPYGAGFVARPSGGPSLYSELATNFVALGTQINDAVAQGALFAPNAGQQLYQAALNNYGVARFQIIPGYVASGIAAGDFRLR